MKVTSPSDCTSLSYIFHWHQLLLLFIPSFPHNWYPPARYDSGQWRRYHSCFLISYPLVTAELLISERLLLIGVLTTLLPINWYYLVTSYFLTIVVTLCYRLIFSSVTASLIRFCFGLASLFLMFLFLVYVSVSDWIIHGFFGSVNAFKSTKKEHFKMQILYSLSYNPMLLFKCCGSVGRPAFYVIWDIFLLFKRWLSGARYSQCRSEKIYMLDITNVGDYNASVAKTDSSLVPSCR